MTSFAEVPDFSGGNIHLDDNQYEILDPEVLGEIVENAVWPLTDGLWRGDWRQDSIPGPSFTYPKAGIYRGRMMEVTLMAECERIPFLSIYDDHDEAPNVPIAMEEVPVNSSILSRTSMITIEEPAPELLDDLLASARERDPAGFETALGGTDTTEENLSQGRVLVKEVTTYIFTTEDDCDKDQYWSLCSDSGYQIWRSDLGFDLESEEEDDGDDDGEDEVDGADPLWKFSKAHLRNLLAAANILGAPEGVLIYLEALAGSDFSATDRVSEE